MGECFCEKGQPGGRLKETLLYSFDRLAKEAQEQVFHDPSEANLSVKEVSVANGGSERHCCPCRLALFISISACTALSDSGAKCTRRSANVVARYQLGFASRSSFTHFTKFLQLFVEFSPGATGSMPAQVHGNSEKMKTRRALKIPTKSGN